MHVEMWPIDRPIPYARNPRRNQQAIDKVAGSIKEFGFRQPIVVDAEGVIIVGHTRLLGAQKLGLAEVPVHVATGLSAAQVKAYRLADNRVGEEAEWDDEMLALEIADLGELGFDLDITGFDTDELDALLKGDDSSEGGEDDGGSELPAEPETVPGELIEMGRHRLLCGDATRADHVDMLMAGKLAGLVFTDPPYGVAWQNNASKRFDVLLNDDKILDVAPMVWAIMAENTAAFVWTAQSVYPQWRAQFAEFYKSTVIWNKGGGGKGDLEGDFMPTYEMALFCTKGRPKFRGTRPSAVWEAGKDAAGDYAHPTQKPVALAAHAIDALSDRGDIVADLFGGSGSTLIACEQAARTCYMMELDPRYCDVIVARWEKLTGKTARRIKPAA